MNVVTILKFPSPTHCCEVQLRLGESPGKRVSRVCEVMGCVRVCVFSVSQHVAGGNGPVVVARPVLGAPASHRPEPLPQRVPGPASHAGATCSSKRVSQKGKRSIYTPVRRRIEPFSCRTAAMHLLAVVSEDGKASCWILTGAPFSLPLLQD